MRTSTRRDNKAGLKYSIFKKSYTCLFDEGLQVG